MKINHLFETPVQDIVTVGNWDNNHSMRDPRDRRLIKNPAVQDKLKKAFDRLDINVNFIFVNVPGAGKFVEEGTRSLDYIQKNLGQEVANEVIKSQENDQNALNIIYTNNSGAERVPMTPWIICHRMAHAFARDYYMDKNSGGYAELKTSIDTFVGEALEYGYGYEFNYNGWSKGAFSLTRQNNRTFELAFKRLMSHLCTFKSARDNNVREYFEIYNELIAQYLITGNNTHNDYPQKFKANGRHFNLTRDRHRLEELAQMKRMYFNDIEYYVDSMFSMYGGKILVM